MEISSNIRLICREVKTHCENNRPIDVAQFNNVLNTLKAANEKCLISRFFCNLPWNIGSLRILATLQACRILTAKEYILSIKNAENIQLILNDFLEGEYALITNLFISAYYDASNSVKLKALLNECLQNLFIDLLENPNLNDLNYLKGFQNTIPKNIYHKIASCHLKILLNLHNSNVSEAFCKFTEWINEGVDHLKFNKDCYEKLFSYCEEDILSQLFEKSTTEEFEQWKFYLILLQTISSQGNQATHNYIKKYLRNNFRQLAALPSKNNFLHLLLTVRASTAITHEIDKNISKYAEWYGENIAEMKYVLKTDEFQNIISLLEQSITYEAETSYLQIHASKTIAPPHLCGKLVQSYKSKCKQHLINIKNNTKVKANQNENAIILIDN